MLSLVPSQQTCPGLCSFRACFQLEKTHTGLSQGTQISAGVFPRWHLAFPRGQQAGIHVAFVSTPALRSGSKGRESRFPMGCRADSAGIGVWSSGVSRHNIFTNVSNISLIGLSFNPSQVA